MVWSQPTFLSLGVAAQQEFTIVVPHFSTNLSHTRNTTKHGTLTPSWNMHVMGLHSVGLISINIRQKEGDRKFPGCPKQGWLMGGAAVEVEQTFVSNI